MAAKLLWLLWSGASSVSAKERCLLTGNPQHIWSFHHNQTYLESVQIVIALSANKLLSRYDGLEFNYLYFSSVILILRNHFSMICSCSVGLHCNGNFGVFFMPVLCSKSGVLTFLKAIRFFFLISRRMLPDLGVI